MGLSFLGLSVQHRKDQALIFCRFWEVWHLFPFPLLLFLFAVYLIHWMPLPSPPLQWRTAQITSVLSCLSSFKSRLRRQKEQKKGLCSDLVQLVDVQQCPVLWWGWGCFLAECRQLPDRLCPCGRTRGLSLRGHRGCRLAPHRQEGGHHCHGQNPALRLYTKFKHFIVEKLKAGT